MHRIVLRVVFTLLAVAALIGGTGGGDAIASKQVITSAYQFDIVAWESTHFLGKWVLRFRNLLPGVGEDQRERRQAIDEFFAVGDQIRVQVGELNREMSLPEQERSRHPQQLQQSIEELKKHRRDIQPVVEEALESEISAALAQMGIIDKLGPLRWPPVDFTFADGLLVLVTSPRDKIDRLDDIVLRSSLSLLTQEELEARVEEAEDLSVLIVRVSGVATYPAHVSFTHSLHRTLISASHEWLHHYLIFRPLGIRWFAGGEMTSINETVANMASREIGDRVFTKLRGQEVFREPYRLPTVTLPDDVFDFRREMRRTRLRLDELLSDGVVQEAETYLEQRRLEFVANGYNIRKLNNAFFAFNGTYADFPGSVSQIEPQLQAIRADSATLAEFLDRVSGITSPGKLERLAREAGWLLPDE